MTNVMEVPEKEWDLAIDLENIAHAIETKDYDQALELAQRGLNTAEKGSTLYTKFQKALREIKINLPKTQKISRAKEPSKKASFKLTDIKGIGTSTAEKLRDAGITMPEQLSKSSTKQLSKINGISENSAERFINAARELLKGHKEHITKSITKPKPTEKKKNPTSKSQSRGLESYITPREQKLKPRLKPKPKPIENNEEMEEEIAEEVSKRMEEIGMKVELPKNTKSKTEINQDFIQESDIELEEKTIVEEHLFDDRSPSIHTRRRYSEFMIPKEKSEVNTVKNKYATNRESQELISQEKAEKEGGQIDVREEDYEEFTQEQITEYDTMKDSMDNEKDYQERTGILKTESHIEIRKNKISSKKKSLLKKIRITLQKRGYQVLSQANIDECDIVAVRLVKITEEESCLVLLPIFADKFGEQYLVAEKGISMLHREPSDELYGQFLFDWDAFKKVKGRILREIIQEQEIFEMLERYARKPFTLEYNETDKQIYFYSGSNSYTVWISPIYVAHQRVAFREKELPFPYLAALDVHIVGHEYLEALISFMERKFLFLIEYCPAKNNIQSKAQLYNDFLSDIRNFSIPMLIITFLLASLIPIIPTITFGLGVTSFSMYLILLGWRYYLYRQKIHIKPKEWTGMGDAELELVRQDFSDDEMRQFIYELFGKNSTYTIKTKNPKSPYNNRGDTNEGRIYQNQEQEQIQGNVSYNGNKPQEKTRNKEVSEKFSKSPITRQILKKYEGLLED
jgi:predicted flap endonuclease-1-like 5' DNA nuclease